MCLSVRSFLHIFLGHCYYLLRGVKFLIDQVRLASFVFFPLIFELGPLYTDI